MKQEELRMAQGVIQIIREKINGKRSNCIADVFWLAHSTTGIHCQRWTE